MVEEIAKAIMHNQKNRFKINYAVGYVLRNIETGKFRYYHLSNKGLLLNTALLSLSKEKLENFFKYCFRERFSR